jgi:hypothetical protein
MCLVSKKEKSIQQTTSVASIRLLFVLATNVSVAGVVNYVI